MNSLTPTQTIDLFKILAALEWQELSSSDQACFCDAGPDARIANVSTSRASDIAELFDIRPDLDADYPLMAIIGGDDTQVEFHGVTALGDPVSVQINLNIIAD